MSCTDSGVGNHFGVSVHLGHDNSDDKTTLNSVLYNVIDRRSMFVFSKVDSGQNGARLLTPVSDSVFIALSDTFFFSPWQL